MKKKLIIALVLVLSTTAWGVLIERNPPFQTGGTATLTVAASDSSAASKMRADYVCDGTADEIQIEAAFAALPTAGGTVTLLEGTFSVAGAIGIADSNVCLEGQGGGTVIRVTPADATKFIYIGDASNPYKRIVVRNLSLTCTDMTHGGHGIEITTNVTECKVLNCFFKVPDAGIYSKGVGVLISGNHFVDCGDEGISLAVGSLHCTIVNNSFEDISKGTPIAAIRLTKAKYCTVTGNIIKDCNEIGIKLEGAENCVVIGNTLYNNGTAGNKPEIELINTGGGTTQNNIVALNTIQTTSATHCILEVSNAAVKNNFILANRCFGGVTADIVASSIFTTVLFNKTSDHLFDNDVAGYVNESGGSLVLGDVVVLKTDANGFAFTTTTTQGDDKVLGMLLETAADNAVGRVLTEGKTVALKANGTIDIAIGDLLGTYTSAGIVQKAEAGDIAFAVALEAYATDDSSGVLDAVLIPPRKVSGAFNYGVDAGTNDTYVVTISGVSSYRAGMSVIFDPNTDNDGACSINVNGLGAKAIKVSDTADPAAAWIKASQAALVVYTGTNFYLINPDSTP